MNARDVKAIVEDFSSWRGNAFTLAMIVSEREKESIVAMLEEIGATECAEQVRQHC